MLSDINNNSTHTCGSKLLLALPDDIFALVTRSLTPRDVLNLSVCCRGLHGLAGWDKVWLTQCESMDIVPHEDLMQWRKGVASYKALCRFLVNVEPVIGLWVHQNPELGNVVYVMPGFVSVAGCRIIPQELGPLGIQHGPVLWSPVFEIVGDVDGSAAFLLHGREAESGYSYVYPGSVDGLGRNCNVLLLEVEPGRSSAVPFNRLAFTDRRNLIETVSSRIGVEMPHGLPLFRGSETGDWDRLSERRWRLLEMYKHGGWKADLSEIRKVLSGSRVDRRVQKKSVVGYFRDSLKQMVGKSSHERNKLEEFLGGSGDTIGLRLHASTARLSCYRAWPNMHESRFALYKLPQPAGEGQGHAGLWGGTFGWPPTEKPGKALFILLLSYEESQQGQRLLIGTKILEGTHYVLHPNGSAMFIANIDEPSEEAFPSDVGLKEAFVGEGIANGYGFRYPGSKPGSLFVFEDGSLVFMWKESRAVLTLQRVDLQQLLKIGERVPPLSPVNNFSYLTKSYSNVYAGFSSSSPRGFFEEGEREEGATRKFRIGRV